MKKLSLIALLVAPFFASAQSTLKPVIAQKADALKDKVIAWRRDFHEHPELGNQEARTAGIVAAHLRSLGIEVQEKVGYTGVVGVLKGGKPGPVVALRADMDGLPVTERGDLPFKSKVVTEFNGQKTGVMHACGHDVHTSSLLGTAHILQQLKDEFEGTIKLIFQPAEEKAPGGASIMIKEGVLENPKPNSLFGQHVATNVPVGKIGFREGMYMASTDELYIKVIGKGGHGAMPDACIDPIVIASHIIVAMQQIISRNKNPKFPSVLTFGKIERSNAVVRCLIRR